MKVGGKYEDYSRMVVNTITQQYKSIYTSPKDTPDISLKPPRNGNSLSEIIITNKDINEAIADMAITSAPGRDDTRACIYKEYADQQIYPIKKIWQVSLESRKLP